MTVNFDFIKEIKKHKNFQLSKTRFLIVTKNQSIEDIRQLLDSGHRLFGENRVQEAIQKFEKINNLNYPELELHLIGPLQTNKIKVALGLFDTIQSIDRSKLIDLISIQMKEKAVKTKNFFLQINIGNEEQKSGIPPEDAEYFYKYATDKLLNVCGLMCIPPINKDPETFFTMMDKLRFKIDKNLLLSMGMSSDYEIALRCKTDLVRIGSKIFQCN